MKGLTDKQQEILDFIANFTQREGMPPTIFEISRKFDVKSATAFSHVRALQRKGYVDRSNKARSLTLTQTDKPQHFSLTLSVPLLGRISAGAPLLSEEHIERHIHVDPQMLPHHLGSCKLFALQVQGESMRDLGILDGDLIIAKQTTAVELGDIIVALVDGETTVKSLYVSDGQWELRPANPDYKSRFVPFDRLAVQGVVIGLQRTY